MNEIELYDKPKIAYVGMSHLGIVSAIVAASKGFDIICYDECAQRIENLSRNVLSINEPKLEHLLKNSKDYLRFTENLEDISKYDIIYVSVDIKTDENGQSDLSEINNYINKINKILTHKNDLVILSQVKPGFTRNIKASAKNIYYQVETLVFGNAVDRALSPERIIIGLKDKNDILSHNYQSFLESFDCPVLEMNYESAELTKISINLFLIAQVSVTNTIASICEKNGANWLDMSPALKLDKRIGEYSYLKPGLGISGGNLERDMATTIELSDEYNTDCSLIHAFKKNSFKRKNWVYENLINIFNSLDNNLKIAIMGLSYKENTDSVKNSPSIETIKLMPNAQIFVYDPVVKWDDKWHSNAKYFDNLYDSLIDCDALLILTPWKEFENIDINKVKSLMRGNLIIDPYAILLKVKNVSNYFNYLYLGGSNNK